MITIELEIQNYLEEMLGERPPLRRLDPNDIRNVALYLKHGFSYYQATLVGKEVIFAIPITDLDLNPGRISMNIKTLSQALGVPVVLVLEAIKSRHREAYLHRRVAFIVPGNQLFIPQLLMDLKPIPATRKEIKYFSPATQCVLIHHLYVHTLNGMDQRSIASVVRYSEMSVSRAMSQLKQVGVVSVDMYGVHFLEGKRELWDQCLPHLRSPVLEVLFAKSIKDAPVFNHAGATALAHYTDMADERRKTYAIPNASYKSIREKHISNVGHIDGEVTIQLWRYYPKFLTETKFVDPFSLYLSFKDEEVDERTEAALESMLNAHL